MRRGDHFKASGKTFGQTALNEQRGGTQQHHFQGDAGMGVRILKQLHQVWPARDSLNFVQHQ
jgi:hypothetical protein